MNNGQTPDPFARAEAAAMAALKTGGPVQPLGSNPEPITTSGPGIEPGGVREVKDMTTGNAPGQTGNEVVIPPDSPIAEIMDVVSKAGSPSAPPSPTGAITPEQVAKLLEGTSYKSLEELSEGYKNLHSLDSRVSQENQALKTRLAALEASQSPDALAEAIAKAISARDSGLSAVEEQKRLEELRESDPEAYKEEMWNRAVNSQAREIEDLKKMVSDLAKRTDVDTHMNKMDAAADGAGIDRDYFYALMSVPSMKQLPFDQAVAQVKGLWDKSIEAGVNAKLREIATTNGAPVTNVETPVTDAKTGILGRTLSVKDTGIPGSPEFKRIEKIMQERIKQEYAAGNISG